MLVSQRYGQINSSTGVEPGLEREEMEPRLPGAGGKEGSSVEQQG